MAAPGENNRGFSVCLLLPHGGLQRANGEPYYAVLLALTPPAPYATAVREARRILTKVYGVTNPNTCLLIFNSDTKRMGRVYPAHYESVRPGHWYLGTTQIRAGHMSLPTSPDTKTRDHAYGFRTKEVR